jgi:magnesium-transporting ATPase (P-type)
MYTQIIFTGAYTIVMCLVFLKLPAIRMWFGRNEAHMMSAFFALFMFAGIFNCFNARTYRLNILSYIRRNRIFLNIMALVFAIQIFLIYFGGTVFRTTGLSFRELRLVALMACTVVIADLIRKVVLRVRYRKGSGISPYSI